MTADKVAQLPDLKAVLGEVLDRYRATAKTTSVKAIVYGDAGTGKTTLLGTARAPILIHSFDQGGTRVLESEIAKGRVYPDIRFEVEQSKAPTAYELWEQEYNKLKAKKVFDSLGAYAIDSITSMSDALMNSILAKQKRAAQVPQLQDYMILGNTLKDILKDLADLPCDVFVLGHAETERDEITGKTSTALMITGKMKVRFPLIFDELWVTQSKNDGKKQEYSLLTANDGIYKAKTRIGSGKFSPIEVPNIKALLAKAGLPHEDRL